MAVKFGRTYTMQIQRTPGVVGGFPSNQVASSSHPSDATLNFASSASLRNAIVINYPLTLELHVERSTLSSCNIGHFVILNLSENTRRQIFKDRFQTDLSNTRQMLLYAGYQSELTKGATLPLIFSGQIRWAYSYRRKQDWVTEIEAFDAGDAILNGQATISQPSGYNIRDVIKSLLGTIPGIKVGAVGDVGSSQNGRGIAVSGNSWEAIKQLAPDAEAFIDNGVANVLAKNEYLNSNGAVFVISSQTGLLETPRKYDDRIDVRILFEPRMRVGMLVQIQSAETYYNGIFSVKGVTHQGTISGATSGQLQTTLCVWRGTEGLKGVNGDAA